jgi:hypothetical protein
MALSTLFYVGPISSASGGADFSIFTGFATGAIVYLLLAGRSVRKEGKAHRDLLDAAAGERVPVDPAGGRTST